MGPTGNFQEVTYYSGTINPAGNGYAISWDRTSGPAVADTSANLNLKVEADTVAPTVTTVAPTGATEPVGSNVTATFDEKMDSNTFTNSTFTLVGPSGAVAGSRSLSTDQKTATLNPTNDLAEGTTYTATVTTGVKDLAGNALAQNKTWTFTTADTTAPETTIDTKPTDPSNNTSPSFTFSGTDNVTSAANSELRVQARQRRLREMHLTEEPHGPLGGLSHLLG